MLDATCHKSYRVNYPPGSALRTGKARELKANYTFFDKKKKVFSDGEVFKEAMMIIANIVPKDEKNGTDILSTLSHVQLGASTIARRMSAMSGNLTEQLDRDLAKSVDNSSTAQLMIFFGWYLMISPQKKNS